MEQAKALVRYPAIPPLRVTLGDAEATPFGDALDVSGRGMLISRADALPDGSSWELVVHSGQPVNGRSSVRCVAEVRWSRQLEEGFNCGVLIKTIARQDAETLAVLVEQFSAAKGM